MINISIAFLLSTSVLLSCAGTTTANDQATTIQLAGSTPEDALSRLQEACGFASTPRLLSAEPMSSPSDEWESHSSGEFSVRVREASDPDAGLNWIDVAWQSDAWFFVADAVSQLQGRCESPNTTPERAWQVGPDHLGFIWTDSDEVENCAGECSTGCAITGFSEGHLLRLGDVAISWTEAQVAAGDSDSNEAWLAAHAGAGRLRAELSGSLITVHGCGVEVRFEP